MKHCYFLFLAFLFLACGNIEEPNLGKQEFGEVSDIEGNKYITVKIGSQVWMAENLKTSVYSDGSPIPQLTSNSAWGRPTNSPEVFKPGWSYFQNNASNNLFHGKLYNWYAVNDPRGLAPLGYHIPSDAEWSVLVEYLGGEENAGFKMKSTTGWNNKGNGDNSSGFNGLPGGCYQYKGDFYGIGENSFWWSSSKLNAGSSWRSAWNRILGCNYSQVLRIYDYMSEGYSVRCLKD
jgi:uncharacterized protein (TIGR02145 family)